MKTLEAKKFTVHLAAWAVEIIFHKVKVLLLHFTDVVLVSL